MTLVTVKENDDGELYLVTIKENDDGELYIELPHDLLKTLCWDEDTELVWSDKEDGSWALTKKENNDTCNEA